MGIKLEIEFEDSSIHQVAFEIHNALSRYEEMLAMVEHCGEMAINTSSVLSPLLKLQKAVLDYYRTNTIAEGKLAKFASAFEAMPPRHTSPNPS